MKMIHHIAIAIAIGSLTLVAGTGHAGEEARDWGFIDLAGKKHKPFDSKKTKALVAVFISTDCPIANYFQPTLREMAKRYEARGVQFVLIHPDPELSAEEAKTHAKEYAITIPVALDAGQAMAKRLKAEFTPEAFVIDAKGAVRYRGRINDMYVGYGKKRRAPSSNDLDDAIAAVLAGKKIANQKTKPIGCHIFYYPEDELKKNTPNQIETRMITVTRARTRRSNAAICTMLVSLALPLHAVTFSEDVAPIIFQNCTSCHRPGEAAPFPLTDYKEVRKRARLIAELTGERFMPPWHAESSDYKFADERRLSEEQIKTVRDWVAAGMPEGDPAKLPAMPDFPKGWQLGKPDLIVEMEEAFEVPASGPDIYRNFVIPLNLSEDKWVKAIEFRPGEPTVVHHSLFFYDTTGEALKLDKSSSEPGFRRMGRFERSGSLGAWAVGGTPRPLPADLAYKLPKGSDLILSTHFHPSGKAAQEKSVVGFHFTDKPPSQGFTGIQLPPHFGATAGIDIPPGQKRYTKNDSFVLPVDAKAFGVSAHAHYLGKEMKMEAVLPDGKRRQLLWIKDYDFDWQEPYNFAEFVSLPKGTRIESAVTWDNSADNPNNPNDPPKRVRWGRESEDEMGSITLLVVAAEPEKLGELQREYAQHRRGVVARRVREVKADTFEDIPKAILDRYRGRYDKNGDGELDNEERAAALEAWRKFLKSRRG